MIVGCYALHLYCDGEHDLMFRQFELREPNEYTGQTERQAKAAARADGWRFKDRKAFCPTCRNKTDRIREESDER